jgi:hypothetical protein
VKHSPAIVTIVFSLAGCLPILSPPVHGKLGGGHYSKPVPITDAMGGRTDTKNTGFVAAGLDSAIVTELPVTAGAGVMSNYTDYGFYLEGGAITRMSPRFRVGATAAGERWIAGGPSDGTGVGARVGLTAEYTSRYRRFAGSERDPGTDGTHDASTTYQARIGSFAIGAFVDVGRRWMSETADATYVMLGLSFRLPAIAGFIDLTEQH